MNTLNSLKKYLLVVCLISTTLLVSCSSLPKELPTSLAIDLSLKLSELSEVIAGENFANEVVTTIKNSGITPVEATVPIIVEFSISTDFIEPPGVATPSATFLDNGLVLNGRHEVQRGFVNDTSITPSFDSLSVPTDTPAGEYYICAWVDPANTIKDSNRNNNNDCIKVNVRAAI